MTKKALSNFRFALRANEAFYLYVDPPDQEEYFAVMIVKTPPFPGAKHDQAFNMLVICAARYKTLVTGEEPRWGWVHLDLDTKDVIGEDLLDLGAVPGRWYYMTVEDGYGIQKKSGLLP